MEVTVETAAQAEHILRQIFESPGRAVLRWVAQHKHAHSGCIEEKMAATGNIILEFSHTSAP